MIQKQNEQIFSLYLVLMIAEPVSLLNGLDSEKFC